MTFFIQRLYSLPMRTRILLLFMLMFGLHHVKAQHACAKSKIQLYAKRATTLASPMATSSSSQIPHETKYDVKFVHLNLQLERNTVFVKGSVKTVATVTAATLDTFQTLLHLNHNIDSIRFNGALVSAIRQDSIVKFKSPQTLNNGASFTVTLYYQGTAPTGGGAIGSGYNTDTDANYNADVSWSLSEAFVAYQWWPCKQILTDKIDSSWVFVTTDSANKVGSNGRLQQVVSLANKKRYEWKSRNPIAYYLISVAIAKYREYNLYAKPQYLLNDSILIQNYIYSSAINDPIFITWEKPELDKITQVVEFLSNCYGMYPFYKEKYGHCMAYFGGAMEHQTMTSTIGFDYYLDAHELGHQWWGDHVTCKTWADIWINEGFAVYSEYLTSQYLDNPNFASKLNGDHALIMAQAYGSVRIPAQDTLNTPRIFDSRLTYAKGGSILHTLRFVTNNDSLWFKTLRDFQSMYKNSNASAEDFKNFYQTSTGINPTQFFNQWYYGEGYPTFNVRYNFGNNVFYLKSTQSVSMPTVTPLFITPMEYRIKRLGNIDTTIRVMHTQAVENYSLALTGIITGVVCDPNNWVINRVQGPLRDYTLGIDATTSIKEIQSAYASISVGPNPFKEVVTVYNPNQLKGSIVCYDLLGKLVTQTELLSETKLQLGAVSKGVYLLKILDENGLEQNQIKVLKE